MWLQSLIKKILHLSEFTLLVAASLFFLAQFAMPAISPDEALVSPVPQISASQSSLYILINREREQRGLKPLTVSPKLESSAAMKACDMRDRHYFNHNDPDGRTTWIWFDLAGYVYAEVGENIGNNLPSNAAAHQRFMASSKHRENILSPVYEEMGVARCGRYVVEHFGVRQG